MIVLQTQTWLQIIQLYLNKSIPMKIPRQRSWSHKIIKEVWCISNNSSMYLHLYPINLSRLLSHNQIKELWCQSMLKIINIRVVRWMRFQINNHNFNNSNRCINLQMVINHQLLTSWCRLNLNKIMSNTHKLRIIKFQTILLKTNLKTPMKTSLSNKLLIEMNNILIILVELSQPCKIPHNRCKTYSTIKKECHSHNYMALALALTLIQTQKPTSTGIVALIKNSKLKPIKKTHN